MTYYPTLHTLRGFAALWVLLLHVFFFSGSKPHLLAPFFKVGWLGVVVFYLLSAFLLGTIYFQQKNNNSWHITHFYKKRFLRIFPAYYFQLSIILISTYWGIYQFPEIKDLIAHLFMYFNLPPIYTRQLVGVWWTLPIEFSFYLLLPLMGLVVYKIGAIWFSLLSLILTIGYKLYIVQISQLPSEYLATILGQLPGVFFTFSLGFVSAYLVFKNKLEICSKYLYLIIPVTIIWIAVLLNTPDYWTGSPLIYFWMSVNDVLFMLIILAIYRSKSNFINFKFFIWLGKISYGIYLWHLPVILLFKDKLTTFSSLLAVTVPLTLLLASLSYYFIEKKFSKLKF